MFKSANDVVQAAISQNQLKCLLLGEEPFAYLPPRSPSPGNTDLALLLEALYSVSESSPQLHIPQLLENAIRDLCGHYEGLLPTAFCILIESMRQNEGRHNLNLPLKELAAELQEGIYQHRERLASDKTGAGKLWMDGQLGELKHASRITPSYGGPSFIK